MLAEWWGDWSSAVGLPISLAGFLITIIMLLKSKSAAEAARDAARDTRQALRRVLGVADVTSAVNTLAEVKRLLRESAWLAAIERCGHLRSLLIHIREENTSLRSSQRKDIQGTIAQVSIIETQLETLIGGTDPSFDVVRCNSVLSAELEKLETLSATVRLSDGEEE